MVPGGDDHEQHEQGVHGTGDAHDSASGETRDGHADEQREADVHARDGGVRVVEARDEVRGQVDRGRAADRVADADARPGGAGRSGRASSRRWRARSRPRAYCAGCGTRDDGAGRPRRARAPWPSGAVSGTRSRAASAGRPRDVRACWTAPSWNRSSRRSRLTTAAACRSARPAPPPAKPRESSLAR